MVIDMKCRRTPLEADVEKYEAGKGLEDGFELWADVVTKEDLIPGGALYLKLDDPIIRSKKKLTPEEVEDEIREKLKMNGIILSDVRLVKAMDTEMTKESKNTSNTPQSPCLTGSLLFDALCAITDEPSPASLENTPRARPF